MLPAGVDTSTPSEINFLIRNLDPIFILILAAWRLCLKIEISLIAIDFLIFPYGLVHYVLPEERKEKRICYAFNLKTLEDRNNVWIINRSN